MNERRTLHDYLELPYTIQLQRDGERWFGRVVELDGCMTEGDTLAEVAEMIVDAMRGWLETALEDGVPIPEPRPLDDYSGKFVVRVPRSLHRRPHGYGEAAAGQRHAPGAGPAVHLVRGGPARRAV